MNQKSFADSLFQNYNLFKENTITYKRLKHSTLAELIENTDKNVFETTLLGKSIENREIYQLKAGHGDIRVVIWSQMHGNETTGTMALTDIFNFFSDTENYQEQKEYILNNCTLFFVPMLNPDGAELFKRRNALDIDINRDAQRLVSPEAQILFKIIDEIKPHFAYNLHDQDPFYSAGDTNFPATISLLTPAYNFAREIDSFRIKSMQLVVETYKILQKHIPSCVAKYSDEYMPSAFGDKVQSLGISTILVESGASVNDPEKQFVRKLNFMLILSGIFSIAGKTYDNEDFMKYDEIPFNKKNKFFNIILRNANIIKNNKKYIADIGIRQKDESSKDVLYIDDIGDLSNYSAYEEYDFSEKEISELAKIAENAEFLLAKISC